MGVSILGNPAALDVMRRFADEHGLYFIEDNCESMDAELAGHTVIWGPSVVEGAFGRRRIAFVEAPGGIRLEFMEQLEEGPA